MFTGIVEELGVVQNIGSNSLCIQAVKILEGTRIGDSIAVNGVCLTVTTLGKNYFTADVMPETFQRTALNTLKHGSAVNLERALMLQSRLGGHIVSGHIDGTGVIKSYQNDGNAVIMCISASPGLLKYIAPKGSVAIDGISLTVVAVSTDNFTVSLIPHTRHITCLKDKQPGAAVNLETDILAKYVEKLIKYDAGQDVNKSKGLSRELLSQYGF